MRNYISLPPPPPEKWGIDNRSTPYNFFLHNKTSHMTRTERDFRFRAFLYRLQ